MAGYHIAENMAVSAGIQEQDHFCRSGHFTVSPFALLTG